MCKNKDVRKIITYYLTGCIIGWILFFLVPREPAGHRGFSHTSFPQPGLNDLAPERAKREADRSQRSSVPLADSGSESSDPVERMWARRREAATSFWRPRLNETSGTLQHSLTVSANPAMALATRFSFDPVIGQPYAMNTALRYGKPQRHIESDSAAGPPRRKPGDCVRKTGDAGKSTVGDEQLVANPLGVLCF